MVAVPAWEPTLRVDTGVCSAGNANPSPRLCLDFDAVAAATAARSGAAGPGSAWVGLTASTGRTHASKQVITSFTVAPISVDLAESFVVEGNRVVAVSGGKAELRIDLRDSCGEPLRALSPESGVLCVELWLLPSNATRVEARVRGGGDGTAAVAARLPAAGRWAVVASLSCTGAAVLEPSYVVGVVGVAKT